MTFDYLQRVVVEGQLDVEDIGQCVLLGRNDLGEEHYLLIKTEMGFSEVIEYGPSVPDLKLLPYAVTLKYNRFEFNQGKLEKIINKFLNDPKKGISQAEVTDIEHIRYLIPNLIDRVFPPSDEELFGDADETDDS